MVVSVSVFKRLGCFLGEGGSEKKKNWKRKSNCSRRVLVQVAKRPICVCVSDLLFSLNKSSHFMFIKNFQEDWEIVYALVVYWESICKYGIVQNFAYDIFIKKKNHIRTENNQ